MFAVVFYADGIFVDTTKNYQLTKSSNLQTNLFYAKCTILSFNNFSNVIHYTQKFGDQCKIMRGKIERRKMKERKRRRKRRERGGRMKIYN